MLTGWRNNREVASEKGKLRQDIDLAWSELAQADRLNAAAEIQVDGATVNSAVLRALGHMVSGELEYISGNTKAAVQALDQSLQILESPHAHYMLGMIYEFEYAPAQALGSYEACLNLDADNVDALRGANRMRNYKKQFRGSWGTFGCLFLLFFPAAFIYYLRLRK